MNVQKRPTSLADPLPKPKIKLWHCHELNSQGLDEFYTMQYNIWKCEGKVDAVTVPTVCFSGALRRSPEGVQQQFATQTLRVLGGHEQ